MAELVGFREIDDRVVHCEGQGLKHLLEAGLAWLDHHHQSVNALNVFPVPDGDTGTNMLLTMQAAYDEIATSGEKNIGKMAQAVARGALIGARGNSGIPPGSVKSERCEGPGQGLRWQFRRQT